MCKRMCWSWGVWQTLTMTNRWWSSIPYAYVAYIWDWCTLFTSPARKSATHICRDHDCHIVYTSAEETTASSKSIVEEFHLGKVHYFTRTFIDIIWLPGNANLLTTILLRAWMTVNSKRFHQWTDWIWWVCGLRMTGIMFLNYLLGVAPFSLTLMWIWCAKKRDVIIVFSKPKPVHLARSCNHVQYIVGEHLSKCLAWWVYIESPVHPNPKWGTPQ